MNTFGLTCVAYATCIVKLTTSIRYFFLSSAFLNGILAFTATFGNGLIIIAVLRSQNLQTPSYLLITSLAFTDLLVGLVYHPLQIILNVFFLKNDVEGVCKVFKTFNFISILLGLLSFIMASCICVDRYLALRLKHRYRVIITKKRVYLLIMFACSLGITLALYSTHTKLFLCYGTVVFSILVFFLAMTCFVYFKVMRTLKLYASQVHNQPVNSINTGFDVLKYKKLLKTMFIIFGCLLFCFIPIVCSHITRLTHELSKGTLSLYFIAHVILGLNSSINPIIYLIRFKEIRHACKKLTNAN